MTWRARIEPRLVARALGAVWFRHRVALCLGSVGLLSVSVVAVAIGRWRTDSGEALASPSPSAAHAADMARDIPLGIAPRTKRLLAVERATVEMLRTRIEPPADRRVNVPFLLHVLRVHGLSEPLEGGAFASGNAIVALLADDAAASAYFGWRGLVATRSGARFRTMGRENVDTAAESHRDQTLAALAELALPLSHPLKVAGTELSLRDVLRDSVANFHLGQQELTWTAMAYALYLPPAGHWVNRFGERFTFDDLALALLETSPSRTSCAGTHLLHALTFLYHADSEFGVLATEVRSRVEVRLRAAVAAAVHHQAPDGSWGLDWEADDPPPGASRVVTSPKADAAKLLATGHLAEWMLYLPEDVPISDDALRLAVSYLLSRVCAAADDEITADFCAYSHAVCALRHTVFDSDSDHPNSAAFVRPTLFASRLSDVPSFFKGD